MVMKGKGYEPLFIEPIFQKDAGDCAIACLTMLLGKPYVNVVQVCPKEYLGRPYNPMKSGMTNWMMIDAAKKLGVTLSVYRKFDIYEDIGILTVLKGHARTQKNKDKDTHAVLLVRGTILDPTDGRLWPHVDTFLQVEEYRTGTILKRED